MNTTSFIPREILHQFDSYLESKGLKFEGILIGGAAIALLYRNTRMTNDFDLLTPIPTNIKKASEEFAVREGLDANWLNNRVVNLGNCKPFGWGHDTIPIFTGTNLNISSISRQNLLRTKVFSFCSRSAGAAIDLPDIESMSPTTSEFQDACNWTMDELKRQRGSKRELREFQEALNHLQTALFG